MLRPSIFGESFLNDWNDWDNWMNFSFPDVEKKLYGKHAAHVMKIDIRFTRIQERSGSGRIERWLFDYQCRERS